MQTALSVPNTVTMAEPEGGKISVCYDFVVAVFVFERSFSV